MYYRMDYESPLGSIFLASDGENLIGLWFEGQKYFEESKAREVCEKKNLPVFDQTKDWLNRYFRGEQPRITELPLSPVGSDFRQKVWRLLCEIPYGQVTTYGEIAKKVTQKMGRKTMSSQAVGGAVAHNPISIIIPCPRVVGADGSLTGYAGGVEKKKKLLELESAQFVSDIKVMI